MLNDIQVTATHHWYLTDMRSGLSSLSHDSISSISKSCASSADWTLCQHNPACYQLVATDGRWIRNACIC